MSEIPAPTSTVCILHSTIFLYLFVLFPQTARLWKSFISASHLGHRISMQNPPSGLSGSPQHRGQLPENGWELGMDGVFEFFSLHLGEAARIEAIKRKPWKKSSRYHGISSMKYGNEHKSIKLHHENLPANSCSQEWLWQSTSSGYPFFQPPQVHGIECPERQHHPLHRSESRARWTPRAESSEVQV